ncbi:DNA excision repair protein ERCC-6-like isoform X2 [Ceratina calcarata]|uniref:DNA repair and recombination protein RAD54-like n=1 Tax=Ceratina calcarata TaxID=156304 RepID=A0AAJ7J9J5_9HYME|nr:DNA excision repair protein ERCC-6-like isoform X2 [Ceratina calcarata]
MEHDHEDQDIDNDNETVNDIVDENLSEKVLSVRSEDSIFCEASKEIEELVKANAQSKSNPNKQSTGTLNDANDCSSQQEIEKQVSTGEITPFQAIEQKTDSLRTTGTFNKTSHLLDLEKYLKQQAELAKQRKQLKDSSKAAKHHNDHTTSIKKAKLPKEYKPIEKTKPKASKRKTVLGHEALKNKDETGDAKLDEVDNLNAQTRHTRSTLNVCDSAKDNTKGLLIETIKSANAGSDSGSEYAPSDEENDSEEEGPAAKKRKYSTKFVHTNRVLDDGDEAMYRQRVEEHGFPKDELYHKIDNLFKVPQSIWKRLYKYQKVSVQWLWELHSRSLGGLLGDEMGLGKTVQVIAFLAGLDSSELLSDGGRFRGLGPTMIVCPATLMEQWVKHFHEWWPVLRVVVLHQSGTYNEYLMHSLKSGGVLVTSYTSMLKHKDLLVASQWHYVILDEGHKIRNPQTKISKAVKEFSTPHRLLLTGSPMQNSLKELWSLFDFILPGKLGTLPAFLEHCAGPITRGGYANATPLQEATALQVATMLRDAITPYMLRRTKNDVQHHVSLPEKNEQVLFCSLTEEQKELYKRYLCSGEVSYILQERNPMESGRYRARLLIALSALRKICNHPDLFLYTNPVDSDEDIDVSEETLEKFGFWKRSGKMTVVRSLLKIWKKQGHKVLLFTQGRQMMHVLESLLQSEEYTYLRMDGTTPMSQRQETIRLFNTSPSYFVFLLTTRVGGLGVNLTGANRVIIYDPDWNPATDAQARERAWRIGQNKRVTIYRLITAGTIEEKMYHRQVFKLLLSNKVLEDPNQRRLFKTNDLVELFNLNEPIDGHSSESDRLFRDSKLIPSTTRFSSNKIEKMRKLAASLSRSISQNSVTQAADVSENYSTDNNNDKLGIEKTNEISEDLVKQTENDPSKKDETAPLTEQSVAIADKFSAIEPSDKSNDTCIEKNTEIISSDAKKNKAQHKHKRNRKSSKSEKHTVSAIFEGERISHLIGRRLGSSQSKEAKCVEDDQYVLEKLFAKASVTSAFQHDSVLSNSGYNSDDKNPMQRLARETAQENMDNIRKSRKWCWKPTWDPE